MEFKNRNARDSALAEIAEKMGQGVNGTNKFLRRQKMQKEELLFKGLLVRHHFCAAKQNLMT